MSHDAIIKNNGKCLKCNESLNFFIMRFDKEILIIQDEIICEKCEKIYKIDIKEDLIKECITKESLDHFLDLYNNVYNAKIGFDEEFEEKKRKILKNFWNKLKEIENESNGN